MKIYVSIQHLDGEDYDHWTFPSLATVVKYLEEMHHMENQDDYTWVISNQPVLMPEDEYSPNKEE